MKCFLKVLYMNADIGEHHPWCVAGNNREVGVGNGVFIQKRQKE